MRKCRRPTAEGSYSRHHSIQIGVPMKTTSLASFALAFATAAIALPAHADPLTIDGNFADWGVKNNGTLAGWTPNSGVLYTVEDQSNANGGYLLSLIHI